MKDAAEQLDLKSLPVTNVGLIHEMAFCFNHEFSESILNTIFDGDFLSTGSSDDDIGLCPSSVYRFKIHQETRRNGRLISEYYFDVDIYNEQTLNKIRLTVVGSQLSMLAGQQVSYDYTQKAEMLIDYCDDDEQNSIIDQLKEEYGDNCIEALSVTSIKRAQDLLSFAYLKSPGKTHLRKHLRSKLLNDLNI